MKKINLLLACICGFIPSGCVSTQVMGNNPVSQIVDNILSVYEPVARVETHLGDGRGLIRRVYGLGSKKGFDLAPATGWRGSMIPGLTEVTGVQHSRVGKTTAILITGVSSNCAVDNILLFIEDLSAITFNVGDCTRPVEIEYRKNHKDFFLNETGTDDPRLWTFSAAQGLLGGKRYSELQAMQEAERAQARERERQKVEQANQSAGKRAPTGSGAASGATRPAQPKPKPVFTDMQIPSTIKTPDAKPVGVDNLSTEPSQRN